MLYGLKTPQECRIEISGLVTESFHEPRLHDGKSSSPSFENVRRSNTREGKLIILQRSVDLDAPSTRGQHLHHVIMRTKPVEILLKRPGIVLFDKCNPSRVEWPVPKQIVERSVSTILRHFPFAFSEQPPVWMSATTSTS